MSQVCLRLQIFSHHFEYVVLSYRGVLVPRSRLRDNNGPCPSSENLTVVTMTMVPNRIWAGIFRTPPKPHVTRSCSELLCVYSNMGWRLIDLYALS